MSVPRIVRVIIIHSFYRYLFQIEDSTSKKLDLERRCCKVIGNPPPVCSKYKFEDEDLDYNEGMIPSIFNDYGLLTQISLTIPITLASLYFTSLFCTKEQKWEPKPSITIKTRRHYGYRIGLPKTREELLNVSRQKLILDTPSCTIRDGNMARIEPEMFDTITSGDTIVFTTQEEDKIIDQILLQQ